MVLLLGLSGQIAIRQAAENQGSAPPTGGDENGPEVAAQAEPDVSYPNDVELEGIGYAEHRAGNVAPYLLARRWYSVLDIGEDETVMLSAFELAPPEGTPEGETTDGVSGPQVTTPTPLFEQFPPTATATSTTPQPTVTPTVVTCRAVVEGSGASGIYLRDAPQGEQLVILAEGTLLTVLPDEPVEAGGFVWRKVRAVGGEEGWAAEEFLTIRAPCGND